MDLVFRPTRAIRPSRFMRWQAERSIFPIFPPAQIFFVLLGSHRDSSAVHAPEGDAAKYEPQLLHPRRCSVRYPPDRRSLARLCRCESSPSTHQPKPKHSKVEQGSGILEYTTAGVGQASYHGDPHYHHGVMKESSPDVSILLCVNTGSTAVQPNIDAASCSG